MVNKVQEQLKANITVSEDTGNLPDYSNPKHRTERVTLICSQSEPVRARHPSAHGGAQLWRGVHGQWVIRL